MPYDAPVHEFTTPPELGGSGGEYPVVIVGAGPVGMAMGLDLAQRGIRSVILERGNTVGTGSKAICWAKRTLEIFDRLGCGQRLLEKGITWNTGKVFFGDRREPLYTFNLLPEDGHHYPAFVNLQQYYVEEYLLEAIAAERLTDVRWCSEAVGVSQDAHGVRLEVSTPEGQYALRSRYLLAADGCRSPIRSMLGLDFTGRVFEDHFLIADIKMKGDFPAERRFWFDPPEGIGTSALLHKQADDVWRTDFQLGWNIDREKELEPENVSGRVRKLLGPDREFTFEWISIYTFECRRLDRFVHGRVIFIGDSAHLVSPFGARGGNGGIQDVDNLGWKLELVLSGKAGAELIESYNDERVTGADENIVNSSRTTDFMTPKNTASAYYRRAVLELAPQFEFARRLVNSGRLSVPVILSNSPLNTRDSDRFDGRMVPGAPCSDAPIFTGGKPGWLLEQLGSGFCGLLFDDGADHAAAVRALANLPIPVRTLRVAPGESATEVLGDVEGKIAERYDAAPGTFYLIRPDQHVAARFRRLDVDRIRAAVARSTAQHWSNDEQPAA